MTRSERLVGRSPGNGFLSYSSFHTYEECPLRWKFLYIDGLPEAPRPYFSFGRSMHLALEAFVTPLVTQLPRRVSSHQLSLSDFAWRPSGLATSVPSSPSPMPVEELLTQYERLWIREGYGSDGEEKRYFLMGRDLLTRYHGAFTSALPRAVAVEEDLSGDLDGVPIHGIIDRIDLTGSGGLEVLDYKTTRELSLRDAANSDQLTFYQILVEQNYERPVEALTLYHLRSLTPLPSRPRGREEKMRLSERVAKVAKGLSSQGFEPKVGPQCSRCEFRTMVYGHLCPLWPASRH